MSVANTFGLSGLEMPAIDFEDTHLLDQGEFDDDFFVANTANTKDTELIFSRSSLTNLGFQSAFLSPIFSPPKHS